MILQLHYCSHCIISSLLCLKKKKKSLSVGIHMKQMQHMWNGPGFFFIPAESFNSGVE